MERNTNRPEQVIKFTRVWASETWQYIHVPEELIRLPGGFLLCNIPRLQKLEDQWWHQWMWPNCCVLLSSSESEALTTLSNQPHTQLKEALLSSHFSCPQGGSCPPWPSPWGLVWQQRSCLCTELCWWRPAQAHRWLCSTSLLWLLRFWISGGRHCLPSLTFGCGECSSPWITSGTVKEGETSWWVSILSIWIIWLTILPCTLSLSIFCKSECDNFHAMSLRLFSNWTFLRKKNSNWLIHQIWGDFRAIFSPVNKEANDSSQEQDYNWHRNGNVEGDVWNQQVTPLLKYLWCNVTYEHNPTFAELIVEATIRNCFWTTWIPCFTISPNYVFHMLKFL